MHPPIKNFAPPYSENAPPARTHEGGYKSVVVLPNGTNYETERSPLDETLWGTNKWLIAHPEVKKLADKGAALWITGENLKVNI